MSEASATPGVIEVDDNKHPNILDVLLNKRSQLLLEIQRHDSVMAKLQEEYSVRLAQIKEEQRPLQDALQHVEALLRIEGWEESPHRKNRETAKSGAAQAISYIDEAYQLLETLGQPTHYRVIFDKLKGQGVFVPGKDGAATLLAKISRDERFKRIQKRGTYALSSWRISAAKSKKRVSRKRTR